MRESFWSGKSVFVTGASGFLGSWLTRALVDSGAKVTAFTRGKRSNTLLAHAGYDTKISMVDGDLKTYDSVADALNRCSVDTIFHLGSQPLVTVAKENPRETFETNIQGTWNILDAARVRGGIERIVVASSVNAYGAQTSSLPYRESYELKARYPYDVSKSAADTIARSYCETFGIPVAVTRCTSLYGGGDFNFDRVVPGTIIRVLRGEQPIIKNGGNFLRDFIYVEDAVDAYLTIAEKINSSAVQGEAFNIGTGKPISVLHVVEKILALMDSSIRPKFLEGIEMEIPDQYVSIDKAREVLGWAARHPLDIGLQETIEWYKTNSQHLH